MKGLFIDLYIDEDVDVLVAKLLRSRGFTAITTNEAQQLQSSDEEQLAFAVTHQMTFLTHNRADFVALANEYAARGEKHFGIIVAERHPPHEFIRRLLRILSQVAADEMYGQVRYI